MAITANKLLGKGESGGALAVRPTTSLVSYKGIDPIEVPKDFQRPFRFPKDFP